MNLQASAAKAQLLQLWWELLISRAGTGQGFVTQSGQQVLLGEYTMAVAAAQCVSVAQPSALCFVSCLTGGQVGDDDEFMTSHPLLQWSLEPQMLTEGVVGAAVWMNNFPALQLKSHETQRGRERQQNTKTKQASGLVCPVSSGPCHVVLHLYPAPDEQHPATALLHQSLCRGQNTGDEQEFACLDPPSYSLLPFS